MGNKVGSGGAATPPYLPKPNMNRFFAIYHGLIPGAPWGVACERGAGAPRFEVVMLCRDEAEATHYAELTGLGEELAVKRKTGRVGNAEGGVK